MNNRTRYTKKKPETLRAKIGPVCFATMVALGLVHSASAAVTADASAVNQPGIQTGANGATIININKASSEGVSHNIYSEFNVDKNGVVLNNSTGGANTQLAGQISGNSNLAGNSATVILNEVRSSAPSQLNGMVEVAGQSAKVIIANPSGITCDGCGFINANHAALTTGTATFDDNGKLTGVKVTDDQVVITGAGMDVDNNGKPQYTDILARSVKLNAELQANNLHIVTGANTISKNGEVETLTANDNAPQLALDVSSLGSMYANKISMIGTEQGVGVRLDDAKMTAGGDLTINVDGQLENHGGLIAAGHSVHINSDAVINNASEIRSGGLLVINSNGVVENRNGKINGGHVEIRSTEFDNASGLVGASDSLSMNGFRLNNKNGEIHSTNDGWVTYTMMDRQNPSFASIENENGVIASDKNLSIMGGNVNNNAGLIEAKSALSMSGGTLVNTNSNAFTAKENYRAEGGIYAGNIDMSNGLNSHDMTSSSLSFNTINNEHGRIISSGNNSDLTLSGSTLLDNKNGEISSAKSLNINYVSTIDNSSGKMSAAKDITLSSSDYTSDAASLVKGGQNVNVNIAHRFANNGAIEAGNNVNLTIQSNRHNQLPASYNAGTIKAGNKAQLQTQATSFTNKGKIVSNNGLNWSGNEVRNEGVIDSSGDITFTAKNFSNAKNAIVNGKTVTISASSIDNQGTITPDYIPAPQPHPQPRPQPQPDNYHIPISRH
ncbi:filamentous hemagglutinin N-terminal domain-containing protein [Cronobacter malonaticus]